MSAADAARLAVTVLVLAAPGTPTPEALDGDRRVQVGATIDDAELKTVDGGREHLIAPGARANVIVFFRSGQERSEDTLKDVAGCQQEFAGKPVRFVGVVSEADSALEVKALVHDLGVKVPVLVDAGDAVYGKLGVRIHPVVLIVDGQRKLVGFEPYRQVNHCDRIRVRIRLALGEATLADVARVDEPPRSDTHSEAGVARRHFNYARLLHEVGDDAKALEEVKKSLAFAPSAGAYALQGEILAALRRCPEALRAFAAATKLNPASVPADRRSCTP